MLDMDRGAITKLIYRKLAEPGFRNRLTAAASDGTRPMFVALREDSVASMIEQIARSGGACNVVVPTLNGFVVLAIELQRERPSSPTPPPRLREDCTVGVFMERLDVDILRGEHTEYAFAFEGPGRKEGRGRAELVAIGG